MILESAINLKTTFDLVLKKYQSEDLTPITGIDPTVLFGLVTVNAPNGEILSLDSYISPYINRGVSALSAEYYLPLATGTALPLEGNYTFDYTIFKRYSNPAVSTTAASAVVNVLGDQTQKVFESDTCEITTGADAGTYTVVSVSYDGGLGQTLITLSEAMTATAGVTALFTFESSKTYEFCFKNLTPSLLIEQEYSCDAAKFCSTDATDYVGLTVSSRQHRIKLPTYPNGTPIGSDVVGTAAVIVIPELWTGQYTSSLEVSGSYVQLDELVVEFYTQGTKTTVVVCDSTASKARWCIAKLLTQFKSYCDKGLANNPYACALTAINTSFVLMKFHEELGEEDYANQFALSIIDIANRYGCDCNLTETTVNPVQVLPSSVISQILTGWQTPLTTAGDMYYRDILNDDARLPIGGSYQYLMVGGGSLLGWAKSEGEGFGQYFGPDTGQNIPDFTIAKKYITDNFEGFVFSHVIRATVATDFTVTLEGGNATTISLPIGTFDVSGYIYKSGADWKVELFALATAGTAPVTTTGTHVATGTIGFDADIVVAMNYSAFATTNFYNHKVDYRRTKNMV
jgi:hypothetical protein